jgi:ribosome biogenesis GTPase
VSPIIILSKTDLISREQIAEIMQNLKVRLDNVPVIAISNETQDGYDAIRSVIEKGKTYCMLGSSGVGKSTLINNLSGKYIMRTDTISQSTNKGRHVTSHRELIVLDDGGILIDNPGMKEVGITDTTGGLEITFDKIISLAQNCKFKDCTHTSETGCAVLESVRTGETDEAVYENYLKMEKEKAHFNTTAAEKKKRDKIFGKIVKDYYKKDIKQKGR